MFTQFNSLNSAAALLFIVVSCTRFELSDGSNFNNFFPVRDKIVIDSATLAKNRFDVDLFNHPDTTARVQFVTPEDVKRLVKSRAEPLLIIFYNPNCSEIEQQMIVPKYVEERHIDYLLLSCSYSPVKMRKINLAYALNNKNQYIIPTTSSSRTSVLQKRIAFQRELDSSLYDRYKDELLFTQLLWITKDTLELTTGNPNGLSDSHYWIQWINDRFPQ